MQIRIAMPGSSDWVKACQLVRAKYKRSYEAEVEPDPDLFAVCFEEAREGAEERAVACAGVTHGLSRKLFSEVYLDDEAERLIQRHEGRIVQRKDVIEVGSLASESHKAGTELVRILPILCWCLGRKYVLCTTTQQLRDIFEAAGMSFQSLQSARRDRLAEGHQDKWGSYYEQQPITGYFCLAGLTHVFASNTGRYEFTGMVINLESRSPTPVAAAAPREVSYEPA